MKRSDIRTWKSGLKAYGWSGCFRKRIGKTGLEFDISPAWSVSKDRPLKVFKSKKEVADAIMDAVEQIDIHGLSALAGKKAKPKTGETLVSVEFGGDTHKPVKMTMIFESKADFRKWKKSAADDLSAYYDKIKVIDTL